MVLANIQNSAQYTHEKIQQAPSKSITLRWSQCWWQWHLEALKALKEGERQKRINRNDSYFSFNSPSHTRALFCDTIGAAHCLTISSVYTEPSTEWSKEDNKRPHWEVVLGTRGQVWHHYGGGVVGCVDKHWRLCSRKQWLHLIEPDNTIGVLWVEPCKSNTVIEDTSRREGQVEGSCGTCRERWPTVLKWEQVADGKVRITSYYTVHLRLHKLFLQLADGCPMKYV